ncbi:P-loop NTPase fold protein [Baaleninema sp.]|uniref:P-loop NTPase fold protein n=1 Tax=Baaleninema sp. TaxID=3101197 RepID=UPI003D018B54
MTLDVREFFRATNPAQTLNVENPDDRKLYIDFSDVRGSQIVEELRDNISFFSPDEPTVQLFTGHIGCGKSTELLRLAAQLRKENFHVVYFESSQDLEMGDIDVSDVLLAIARRVSESLEELEKITLQSPKGLQGLLNGAAKLLQTEIDLSAEVGIPGVGQVSASTEGTFNAEVGVPGVGQVKADREGVSFVALGLGKITAKAKNSPELRSKLREYLEVRTTSVLDSINQELIEPAIDKLKQVGKQGLVVVIDNLDRVERKPKPWGRTQPAYLFVDRGEQLRQLNCHVIYTLPLSLLYSNDLNQLTNRFGCDPKVLPMVPVRRRDGSENREGLAKMRQMALVRAFPNLDDDSREQQVSHLFETPELLDELCRLSGGHVREFLRLLNDWIRKDRKLPLSRTGLEAVVRQKRDRMTLAITDDEWELLRQVRQNKKVTGDEGYDILIRSMFVYEYRDGDGSWFDVNPILETARPLSEES